MDKLTEEEQALEQLVEALVFGKGRTQFMQDLTRELKKEEAAYVVAETKRQAAKAAAEAEEAKRLRAAYAAAMAAAAKEEEREQFRERLVQAIEEARDAAVESAQATIKSKEAIEALKAASLSDASATRDDLERLREEMRTLLDTYDSPRVVQGEKVDSSSLAQGSKYLLADLAADARTPSPGTTYVRTSGNLTVSTAFDDGAEVLHTVLPAADKAALHMHLPDALHRALATRVAPALAGLRAVASPAASRRRRRRWAADGGRGVARRAVGVRAVTIVSPLHRRCCSSRHQSTRLPWQPQGSHRSLWPREVRISARR